MVILFYSNNLEELDSFFTKVFFIKNVVFMGIMKIPFKIGKAIVLVAFIYYTIDFTISAYMSIKGKVESEDNNILQFKV